MKSDQRSSLHIAKIIQNGVFVEIGTWEGDFSYELLEQTNCKKLYCIDPYRHFTNNEYPDGMNRLSQLDFDNKFNTIKDRFKKYGDRVEFIRLTSEEAIDSFTNNTIDYIYIDGNHDYKYVYQDINLWYPKVKQGGWICGDDLYSTNLDEHNNDGNITKVWSYDNYGNPSCWGKYGTYKALVDCSKNIGFSYSIVDTQFHVLKE